MFVIQKLLKSRTDLHATELELISIWNCLNKNQNNTLIQVYSKFFNEVWLQSHIAFYIQSHMVID